MSLTTLSTGTVDKKSTVNHALKYRIPIALGFAIVSPFLRDSIKQGTGIQEDDKAERGVESHNSFVDIVW